MKQIMIEMIGQSLINEKNDILNKSRTVDIDNDGDETDEIQASIIATVASQLSSRDGIKLRAIDNALRKISEGNFGLCEECEEPIAEKRLLINPCFTLCISCAELKELEASKKRV